MKCWKCGREWLDLGPKLSFRALCDYCHSWQHCCKNCKNYRMGKPNDCRIPGTDPIGDRTAANLCDEFIVKGDGPDSGGPSLEDVSKRLFKD